MLFSLSVTGRRKGGTLMSATLVDQFAAYQRLRGWSPLTIRRRTQTLTQLAHVVPLHEATTDDIEQWLASKPSTATRHAYRADLRAFYAWAVERGKLDHDPARPIDPIKVPAGLPRPVERGELAAVIHQATGDMKLMLMLGAYVGLRRSEIARLTTDDIEGGVLTVRGGKGGKDRRIPLHPALAGAFAGRHGQVFAGATPESVGGAVGRYLRAHGIDATAHQLRHTFGTELARVTGGDVLVVGQMMGHSSASTTLGYTRLADGRAASAVAGMYDGAA